MLDPAQPKHYFISLGTRKAWIATVAQLVNSDVLFLTVAICFSRLEADVICGVRSIFRYCRPIVDNAAARQCL